MRLRDFTQERLSAFLINAETGRPERRVPVYAEAVLTSDDQASPDPADLPDTRTRRALQEAAPHLDAPAAEAIAERIDPDWATQNDAARLEQIYQLLFELMRGEGLLEAPRDEADRRIRELVERVAAQLDAPRPRTAPPLPAQVIPLGVLASDHAGFVSFDLARIPLSAMAALPSAARARLDFKLYPMLLDQGVVYVLEQGRIAPDAIVAKIAIPSETRVLEGFALNLPALQNPGLIDWRLSPGSFAAVPQTLIGADGCETLVPANFAISQFHIRQVMRLTEKFNGVSEPCAYVNEYAVSIIPLGHSLGEVLYTLPLAPGESARLAVIDWRRAEAGQKDDKTTITESLVHDQTRDRTISETVEAALDEWQRGGSVMGGLAGGAGASGGSGGTSVVGGGMMSVGGAYATSSGSRDLTASTVQKVTDAIHQSSVSRREMTSSVVVQVDQTESQTIETRAFANHNRGHTLTVIYYEVLRHFRLVTEFTRRYKAVLLPRRDRNFDDDNLVLNKRYLLEPALLDPRLAPGFEALRKLDMWRKERARNPLSVAIPVNEADFVIKQVELRFAIGEETSTNAFAVRLYFTNGNHALLTFGGDWNINKTEQFDNENATFAMTSDMLAQYVTWGTASHLEIRKESGNDLLRILSIEADILGAFGRRQLVKHIPGKVYEMEDDGHKHTMSVEQPPPAPPMPSIKTPEQELAIEEYQALLRLKEHLKAERVYYGRILDLGTHPDDYAIEFESRSWGGGGMTIDHVAPSPLEIMGSKVAFPLISQTEIPPIEVPTVERLISLPTRGVFAEAKLGHCNVAEEIDETRFWRWGEHALPFTASDIAAVQPIQPKPSEMDLGATPMPGPVITIQNAPSAPDPTGMAAALKLMATPDIFRDMSAKAEVGALLEDLINGSVSMAQAANKAREIQAKSSSGGGKTSTGPGDSGRGGGWDPGGGGRGDGGGDPWLGEDVPGLGVASGERRDSPREQLNQLSTLKAFNRAGMLSDEETQQAGAEYIRANLPNGGAPAPDPWPLRVTQAFLDGIATVNFANGADIDNWFTQKTGQAFIPWFNATQANKGFWAQKPMRKADGGLLKDKNGNQLYFHGRSIGGDTAAALQQRFTDFWNLIPTIYDPGGQIGLVDFLSLMAIAINEVSGNLRSISEIGSMKYMFEPKGGASSYNVKTGVHQLAYDLFHNADFNAAHAAKPLGAQLKDTPDPAWKATTWPAGVSSDPAVAVYVSEADFYKFRGRGVIQTTWRGGYQRLVNWILGYAGTNAVLQQYKTAWTGQDVQKILTQSSNADWDKIFGEPLTIAKAVALHSAVSGDYLSLGLDAPSLNGSGVGSIRYMGYRISGSGDYGRNFYQRVVQMMDGLGNKPAPPPAPGVIEL